MAARFIVGNASLKDIRDLSVSDDVYAIDLIQNNSILIIGQPSFYILNEQEIIKWCNSSLTKWTQKGMILGFINDEERNLFLMQWA
jgi:hypothetical protein